MYIRPATLDSGTPKRHRNLSLSAMRPCSNRNMRVSFPKLFRNVGVCQRQKHANQDESDGKNDSLLGRKHVTHRQRCRTRARDCCAYVLYVIKHGMGRKVGRHVSQLLLQRLHKKRCVVKGFYGCEAEDGSAPLDAWNLSTFSGAKMKLSGCCLLLRCCKVCCGRRGQLCRHVFPILMCAFALLLYQ